MNMKYSVFQICLVLCIAFLVVKADYAISEQQKVQCYADISFVLDGSGSVGRVNWQKTLEFVWRFAGSLPFDLNKYGVVSFGNEANVEVRLDDFYDYESFKRKVETIPYLDENTNTADGLRKMRSLYGGPADRPQVPNIGILITDGKATRETQFLQQEANAARMDGINMFAIGIGSQYDLGQLESIIANRSRVFTADDFNDLLINLEKIIGLACTGAPEPTTPPPLFPCIDKHIAFVVDASGSIEKGFINEVKQFLKNFVNSLPFEFDYNQLALVTYSTESFVKAKLGELKSREDFVRHVDLLEHVNQRTNLSGALKVVREEIFTPEFIVEGKDNVVVVIGDMHSNTDRELLPEQAQLAKKHGLKVFAVGLGNPDMYEMSVISSEPKNHFMHFIESYKALARFDVSKEVKDHVCKAPYPSYKIDLRREECYSDIIFVMENRDQQTFEKEKEMVMDLAGKLGDCLYGVVMITDQSYSAVPFDSYESVNGFISQVERLSFRPSNANILSGFNVVERMFSSRSSAINLGTQRYRYRYRSAEKLEEKSRLSKSVDLSQLVVFMTGGNYYVDMNQMQFSMDKLRQSFPNLGVLAIGYGNQVDMNLLKMVANEPQSMFIMKEENFDAVKEKADLVLSAISAVIAAPYYHCDFEKFDSNGLSAADSCDFIQKPEDDFDWLIISGSTPSMLTGPKAAWNGTYYAYIEASNAKLGQKAELSRSSYMANRMECCLCFHYNMYGWHTGKLEVFSVDPFGKEKVTWMRHGPQGEEWQFGMAKMVVPDGGRIGFRATMGSEYSSDIAIDAVSAHYGACPVLKQYQAEDSGYKWFH